MTCGGSGHRQRKRSCIPGTANPGSQDVTCLGNSFERDETCGSDLPCPDPHCPDGYQYSKEYVLIRAVVRFSNVGVRIVIDCPFLFLSKAIHLVSVLFSETPIFRGLLKYHYNLSLFGETGI